MLFDGSVAVQMTGFTPYGNVVVPNEGVHTTVALPLLSVAVGVTQPTVPVDKNGLVAPVKSDGHVITGGVTSCTVTVNWQVALLAAVSYATQVTSVVPAANTDPEAGVHAADAIATLSMAVKL